MNEEDTVTVGQEIAKLELGGAPQKKEQGAEQPRETKEPEKPQEPSPAKQAEPAEPAKPKEQPTKPTPSAKPKESAPKPQGAADITQPAFGSREERRVSGDLSACLVPCTDLSSRF